LPARGLLGTYTFYGVVTSMAAGIFGSAFLDAVGIWPNPPDWSGFLIGGLALLGVWALTVSPVRRGTRVLLTVEGITVLLILLVGLVVLVKLIGGSGGKHLTLTPFSVAPGTDTSALFLGVVFGFLSFAGLEAAATLGEEARNPAGTFREPSWEPRSSVASTSSSSPGSRCRASVRTTPGSPPSPSPGP
jgi:amino acid transporter